MKGKEIIERILSEPKNVRDYRRLELSMELLLGIALRSLGNPGSMWFRIDSFVSEYRLKTVAERQKMKRAIQWLKKERWIELQGEKVSITKTGKENINKAAAYVTRIPTKNIEWDGLWRIVVFDIPEDEKKARDALAAKLKILGFQTLQKSVFVFPYPCFSEVELVTRFHEIEDHVTYITAKSISNEQEVKELFGSSYFA